MTKMYDAHLFHVEVNEQYVEVVLVITNVQSLCLKLLKVLTASWNQNLWS